MVAWRPISGYEGYYEVSNLGDVRSLDRTAVYTDGRVRVFPSRVLSKKGGNGKLGYLQVALCKNGIDTSEYVHRLVAKAFLPLVTNKDTINHKNGNKLDNTVDNLEWCTQADNMRHAFATNLVRELNGSPKVSIYDVMELRNSVEQVVDNWCCKHGVHRQTAIDAISSKSWRKVNRNGGPNKDK